MAVIERLLAEPQRFDFFQAVRLLLLWLEERGVPPQRALDQHLRFANSLSLRFPAGQVEALTLERHGDAVRRAGVPGPQFRLTPTFMGLLGAHGTLPAHVTERIQEAQALDKGPDGEAARAFLDMLSTRMLALFYGAWKKYRIEHAVAGPADGFMPLLLALGGFSCGGLHGAVDGAALAAGVDRRLLAQYAGVLRQGPASAALLGRMLSDVFGVPVAVEEGIGHWDRLAPPERTALGGANAVLGQAALLGARCWRPDLRVRVRIGPLSAAQFERFLPRAPAAASLRTLLGLFAAPTLAYEIVLVLRRQEVGAIRLGGAAGHGAPPDAAPPACGHRRLGLDSYLATAPTALDRADMRYELRPLAPLPPLSAQNP